MVIDDKDLHPGLCDTRHKAVELPGRTSVILQESAESGHTGSSLRRKV